MSDVTTKICTGSCRREQPATVEYFVADKSAKDGLRGECKKCYSERRKVKKSPQIKALARLDRLLKAAQAVVADPASTHTALHKANQDIRNHDKRREKLLEPLETQRRELETAARLAETSPSLERIRAQFYWSPFSQSHTNLAQMVVEMKAVLVGLTGPADALAHAYLTKLIATVESTIISRAVDAKQKAQAEQDLLNSRATQRAIDEIHDEWLPRIRAAKNVPVRDVLRKQLWKLKRIAEDVVAKSTDKDDTGAQNAVVADALAKEYDKLARLLYGKDEKPLNETDTLENIQSRLDQANAAQEWLEKAEADRQKYWADLEKTDPKRFARESRSLELQIRGDGPLADLQRKTVRDLRRSNPREYERRALEALKPRKVAQQAIVYVVPTADGVEWYWPDGRIVRRGGDVQHAEIIKDALHGWVMAPEPASAEYESPSSSAKMELNQHDDGTFHWEPEGSQGTWSQQNDGTWKQSGGGISQWGHATPIVFRNAEPQVEEGRDHFRHGTWWTLAEIQKTEGAAFSEIPPAVLPPLQRVVADSIAVEPPPNAIQLERMNRPAETAWQKHERKQREEKIAQQAMLRGKFIWNFKSA